MSDIKTAPPTYQQQETQQPQQYQQTQQYQQPEANGHYQAPQPVQPAQTAPSAEHYGTETKGSFPAQAPQGYSQTGSVMPIAALTSAPAPIHCPSCNQRAMTKTEVHAGNTTHAWAVGLGVLVCCCCIPYCISSTKDVDQRCSNCNALVATWHRSGRTVVHIH